MGARGPKPRPPLQVVREGNPGKRPVKAGVVVPAGDLVAPNWELTFPRISGDRVRAAENARARRIAAAEWRRVVPMLSRTAGLAAVDQAVVVDYCVTVARLDYCERRLSLEGLVVQGQRGPCRNPLTTVASQYRTQLGRYIGELGLSPSARGRLTSPEGGDDDDDDPFD